MNNLVKVSSGSFLPALIGLSVTWLGFKLINSEKSLETRKVELEIQLSTKNINVV